MVTEKGVKEFLGRIKDSFGIEPGGNKYLLVTGDITDDGKVAQYKKAGEALRSGRSQEIQYYLDANDSAQNLALYHVKVEGERRFLDRVSPRLWAPAWDAEAGESPEDPGRKKKGAADLSRPRVEPC